MEFLHFQMKCVQLKHQSLIYICIVNKTCRFQEKCSHWSISLDMAYFLCRIFQSNLLSLTDSYLGDSKICESLFYSLVSCGVRNVFVGVKIISLASFIPFCQILYFASHFLFSCQKRKSNKKKSRVRQFEKKN